MSGNDEGDGGEGGDEILSGNDRGDGGGNDGGDGWEMEGGGGNDDILSGKDGGDEGERGEGVNDSGMLGNDGGGGGERAGSAESIAYIRRAIAETCGGDIDIVDYSGIGVDTDHTVFIHKLLDESVPRSVDVPLTMNDKRTMSLSFNRIVRANFRSFRVNYLSRSQLGKKSKRGEPAVAPPDSPSDIIPISDAPKDPDAPEEPPSIVISISDATDPPASSPPAVHDTTDRGQCNCHLDECACNIISYMTRMSKVLSTEDMTHMSKVLSTAYPLNNRSNIENLALTLTSLASERMPESWGASQVTTLLHWYAHALSMKERHYRHAKICYVIDKFVNIPSVLLSLASSIMVIYASDCGSGDIMSITQICISLSAFFVAMDGVIDLGDRKQQHLHSARNFSALAEEIRTELILDSTRKRDISTFLSHVSQTFRCICAVSPLLVFGGTSPLGFDPDDNN